MDKYEILEENNENCIYKVMILFIGNKDNYYGNS